jgi:predicted DNA-binding transcriptional regulator AlpA
MRLLSWEDLRERGIQHSRSQLWRKIRQGSFPRPVYVGKFPAWPEAEIDTYIESLVARRDGKVMEAAHARAA